MMYLFKIKLLPAYEVLDEFPICDRIHIHCGLCKGQNNSGRFDSQTPGEKLLSLGQ